MINHEITMRLATIADAETIAEFSRRTFYETFAPHNTTDDMELFMNEQFTRQLLIEEVGVPSNIFFLAYAGAELAGYIKLRDGINPKELNGFGALEIARIYAAIEMIGKGVGNVLMQQAINIAQEKNKEFVWLAVWKKNNRAIDFYTRWGFKKFGQQVFLLGRDVQKDWLMKKALRQDDKIG